MRKFLLSSLVFFITYFHSFAEINDFEIKVRFKNLKNTNCYLGFHFGVNKYIRDTGYIDKNGICVFKSSGITSAEGVYLIAFDNKNYFELVVNESNIYVETDTTDFIGKMTVIQSLENKVFYDFLRYMRNFDIEFNNNLKLRDEFHHQNNQDTIREIENKLHELNSRKKAFKDSLIQIYPDLFIIKIIQTSEEPEPRAKMQHETKVDYSRYVYNFYQHHYFDNVDFSDYRLLRTPLIESKIDKKTYFRRIKEP